MWSSMTYVSILETLSRSLSDWLVCEITVWPPFFGRSRSTRRLGSVNSDIDEANSGPHSGRSER
jgi:hypothetical protein